MGNNVNPARKILLIATGGTIACRETALMNFWSMAVEDVMSKS